MKSNRQSEQIAPPKPPGRSKIPAATDDAGRRVLIEADLFSYTDRELAGFWGVAPGSPASEHSAVSRPGDAFAWIGRAIGCLLGCALLITLTHLFVAWLGSRLGGFLGVSSVLGGVLVLGGVVSIGLIARLTGTRLGSSPDAVRIMLSTLPRSVCAGCGYDLTACKPDSANHTVCSECGAAWDLAAWSQSYGLLLTAGDVPDEPSTSTVLVGSVQLQVFDVFGSPSQIPGPQNEEELGTHLLNWRRNRRGSRLAMSLVAVAAAGGITLWMSTITGVTRQEQTLFSIVVMAITGAVLGLALIFAEPGTKGVQQAAVHLAASRLRQQRCPCCLHPISALVPHRLAGVRCDRCKRLWPSDPDHLGDHRAEQRLLMAFLHGDT